MQSATRGKATIPARPTRRKHWLMMMLVWSINILLVAAAVSRCSACPFFQQEESAVLLGPSKEDATAAAALPPHHPPVFRNTQNRKQRGRQLQENVDEAIADARSDIRQLLDRNLMAKFVRLIFHDCIGGMCDGCVFTENSSNFGLDLPIAVLQDVADDYADFLTRGDVWVLAAMVALEEAQPSNSGFQSFDMQWVGRPDCGAEGNRGPDHDMFSSHFTTSELLDFMSDQFGFSTRDTVAIMGSHSLGRAVQENSGFDGRAGWDAGLDLLTNDYYTVLLGNGFGIDIADFRQELQDNGGSSDFGNQFLWRPRPLSLFMLNADMALTVDLEGLVDPDDGFVTCVLSDAGDDDDRDVCPPATSTLEIALEYADDGDLWISDFHDAFMKMTSVGCDNDNCIEL